MAVSMTGLRPEPPESAIKRLALAARLLVGLLFLVTGALKITDPAAFHAAVANYRLLPAAAVAPAAWFLPWLELVCGLALVAGPWRTGALALVAVMLLVFSGTLAAAWWRGLDIDCGCFGRLGLGSAYGLSLARNAALLLLVAWLAGRERPVDGRRVSHIMIP